jgi:Domain of unknown function (DUF4037)
VSGFVPGLQLSELFYREAVQPILEHAFPGISHSAALLGSGSEVLGFDTVRSIDHEWGPRTLLFLSETDYPIHAAAIAEALRQALPHEFLGYPTNFGPPDAEGIRLPLRTDAGPVEHKVVLTTLPRFLHDRLGIESYQKVDIVDWLVCSEQRLLEVTAGSVFHDGLGELERARAALAYYPRDVWLYLLAAQWSRIAQQEAFVGRCGEVGDELGSALVAADLVRDVMRLGFLMERRYAPYSKWFGIAFARLACAGRLGPLLDAALAARTWPERERHLSQAYEAIAAMHNDLCITDPLPTGVTRYHGRPFSVIHGGRFAEAIRARIVDERVRRLPDGVGAIDQFVNSSNVLEHSVLRQALKAVYPLGN